MSDSILILGRMFPPETEKEAVGHSRGMISSAASAHMEKIIKGIDSAFDGDVRILNVMPVSSFPRWYDKPFVSEYRYSHTGADDKNDISIGFFNLTVVKNLSIQHRLDCRALEWARSVSTSGGRKFVIAYTMNEIFLKTCVKIKRVCPECHICTIVPDLPAYTDLDKSGLLYKLITDRRAKRTNSLCAVTDSFVFLTKQMADYFPVKRPYIVSEAIASETEIPRTTERADSVVTVAYTGSFTKKYGIMELLAAIEKIKSDKIRFVICGSGEAHDIIAERAKTDSRIDFRGMVTHAESLEIQRAADILINPRANDGEYTKYSFPSKIMEYMSTGRPVMCFKLDGIPDEYDNYLTYFSSADEMAEEIEKMCALPRAELDRIGAAGAEFVRREKTSAEFGEALRALVSKKRLLICSDDLCIGGTTTSLLSLLNMLDTGKYSVDLITPTGSGELMSKLPPYVNVIEPVLEKSRLRRAARYLLRGYLARRFIYSKTRLKKYPKGQFQLMSGIAAVSVSRRAERYYDAAVGYMEGFADNYVIKKVNAAKKLLYVHVNYDDSGLDPKMDELLFRAADRIAAVSADCAESLKNVFPDCADKVSVVENPISAQLIRALADEKIPEENFAPESCFNIVTAARLANPHKAIDRAVMSMARLKRLSPVPVKWYVFGDGSDRDAIEQLIRENGLENDFILMGARRNVYPYIKKADLFALSSRYEGKPMCVTEAQILGCVPVVTEYGSARAQIRSGIDGVVCENSDGGALADALCGVIKNPRGLYEMRRALGERDYSVGLDDFYRFIGEI